MNNLQERNKMIEKVSLSRFDTFINNFGYTRNSNDILLYAVEILQPGGFSQMPYVSFSRDIDVVLANHPYWSASSLPKEIMDEIFTAQTSSGKNKPFKTDLMLIQLMISKDALAEYDISLTEYEKGSTINISDEAFLTILNSSEYFAELMGDRKTRDIIELPGGVGGIAIAKASATLSRPEIIQNTQRIEFENITIKYNFREDCESMEKGVKD